MSPRSRNAAFQAPQPPPAAPISENPAVCLESMFLHIWTTSMRDLPFVNAALSVEAVGFRRWNSSKASVVDPPLLAASTSDVGCALGDWVGAVITPWFINLFVLPGGGNLWSDRRSGERCQINFPIGPLEFIADYSPSAVIPSYQYCPLFAPPSQIASQAAARAAAMAALDAMFRTLGEASDPALNSVSTTTVPTDPLRRAFFRRVVRR
ncbi:MAG: [NiFe]-hydrogenase assembly chaperone HybE [Candidatus Accumulibacter sp.]|uniref:[NiFe]-hydrogenase assembly chaperone HybE n=1 Tax=Accumulibacter sp. TaxID=2053492 RepID=UPI001ACE019C|nr:[NiFe]-hydrogenase assembly chaperone HybE [Accumulibacter sp.]MBN8517340.1 [NiFe]-hydrogenase assembly chaperone HybE [Accumulibacter sp.]MBO3710884.1 [NiFe]-hydrogenase assembly chaperone HybE [Accumulibacter sp.]